MIDCVTLWITNLMLGLGGGPEWKDPHFLDALVRSIRAGRGRPRLVRVPNEVRSGRVPSQALSRRFGDR